MARVEFSLLSARHTTSASASVYFADRFDIETYG
jgi:hypothetical protein